MIQILVQTEFEGNMISHSSVVDHSPKLSELWESGWPQTLDEFEMFVTVFQKRMFRFIYYRIKNRQDAEDLLQALFLKSYNNREKLRKVKSQVGAYLYRMALNACIDHCRKRARVNHVNIDDENLTSSKYPSTETEFTDELNRIGKIMQQIPAKQAEVLRLRVVDNLSFAEIAKVIGCFETTARTRYRYGVKKLRHIIREEEK
jgi:RNA polymerase sigma-70 factor, ECF subfamily